MDADQYAQVVLLMGSQVKETQRLHRCRSCGRTLGSEKSKLRGVCALCDPRGARRRAVVESDGS